MKLKIVILFLLASTVLASEESIGYFGPYSPKVYKHTQNKFNLSFHEYWKCIDYFRSPGTISEKDFWKHYRKYVEYQIDLEQYWNKDMSIESVTEIKTEGLKEKRELELLTVTTAYGESRYEK